MSAGMNAGWGTREGSIQAGLGTRVVVCVGVGGGGCTAVTSHSSHADGSGGLGACGTVL
jgi:hypothetical protein